MIETVKKTDLDSVNLAFSRQAAHYDESETGNEILRWMRDHVRTHTLSYLSAGNHILELNAGTGADAFFFADRGFYVHATDLSDGMIEELNRKVSQHGLGNKVTVQKCSYTHLSEVAGQFDYVFSNFGGLNCVEDLSQVANQIKRLLKPGGCLTWVIMPRICPWELLSFFWGNFNLSVRRLRQPVANARIEDISFNCYYHSPESVMRALGQEFQLEKLQGLASWSPPPHMSSFPKRFRGLYRFLAWMDGKTATWPPFNRWADHFILTARYRP